jgi:hypothetical protein
MVLTDNEDEAQGKVWEMDDRQRCFSTKTLIPENTEESFFFVIMYVLDHFTEKTFR